MSENLPLIEFEQFATEGTDLKSAEAWAELLWLKDHCWYERIAKLEAEITALKQENRRLSEIERVARLYLEHGEPELADDLEALLTGEEQEDETNL